VKLLFRTNNCVYRLYYYCDFVVFRSKKIQINQMQMGR